MTSRWIKIRDQAKCSEMHSKLAANAMHNLDIYKNVAWDMPEKVKEVMIDKLADLILEIQDGKPE